MRVIRDLILAEQAWLVRRVIHYAKLTGYTQYASTQQLDWEEAVKGLSHGMAALIDQAQPLSEFAPAMDFNLDPVINFGIQEARKHRSRGVTIIMFFGLVKYFRRAFTDLVESQNFSSSELFTYRSFIIRFFDHVEMGFIDCWTKQNQDDLVAELQTENRRLVLAKAQAEAIVASLPVPVLLIALDGRVLEQNPAAQALLDGVEADSAASSSPSWTWLRQLLEADQTRLESSFLFEFDLAGADGPQPITAYCSRVEDVSERFSGLVVMLVESGTQPR
jgi:PAS domain-containing protein